MDGKRRWLGWIAIGLGALALLVSLSGRSVGAQMMAGPGGASMPQPYAQQGAAPQNGAVPPGASTQQGAAPQNGAAPAGPNAQQGGGRAGGDRQRGPAAPGAVGRQGSGRQGGGRPGDAGFGVGGWFGMPFRLLGGVGRLALVALVVGLGVWLIRGRQASASASNRPAEPAQEQAPEQLSPTGEAYTEEADTDEPGDQRSS